MGYEINYEFKNSGEEEYQSSKMRVGKPTEDTTLEELAGRVMSLFAKRNCDVRNIEIYEYTKKKINFRESEDGIFLKNKKFKFGHGPAISNDMDKDQLLKFITSDPELLNELKKLISPGVKAAQPKTTNNINTDIANGNEPVQQSVVPHVHVSRKPMRYEVFNPDEYFKKDAAKLNFKIGNKYPIFEEKMAPDPRMGMMYLVKDSGGKMQRISDRFFTPEIHMSYQSPEESVVGNGSNKVGGGPKLSYQESGSDDMLVLRR